jgi:hypothetical protein
MRLLTRPSVLIPGLLAAWALAVLAANGVIDVLSTNEVFESYPGDYPWEPTAASNPSGNGWALGWNVVYLNEENELLSDATYLATSSGSVWQAKSISTTEGTAFGDLNLAWDSVRGRYVFAAIDPNTQDVWYGYGSGTAWVVVSVALQGAAGNWDFPSIGVDSGGRIIIGATKIASPATFNSAVSTNAGVS